MDDAISLFVLFGLAGGVYTSVKLLISGLRLLDLLLFRIRLSNAAKKYSLIFKWQGSHDKCAHFSMNDKTMQVQVTQVWFLVPVGRLIGQLAETLNSGAKEV